MKKAICILALFFFWLSPNEAQVGINYTFSTLQASEWNEVATQQGSQPIFTNFQGFGITYWFRLRSYRWEFLPELRAQAAGTGKTYRATISGFALNNRIYFFDFLNDCDCPTFSKQNTFFKRGFFLSFSLGINRFDFKRMPASGNSSASHTDQAVFALSGGLGLDIGLSKRVTLTPLMRYRYYLGPKWTQLQTLPPFENGSPTPPPGDHWGMVEFGVVVQLNRRS
ncbi:MAG TPA: hypothetical protein ENJ88_01440 [Phaeodactylibacter sp.]|nr:hypothetical protein [Phaeodactylibacter sp.]